MLKVRPHTKSGGWGGGGAAQSTSGPIYEKWGGGGGSPLQVRYLCLAHVIVNNERLQF